MESKRKLGTKVEQQKEKEHPGWQLFWYWIKQEQSKKAAGTSELISEISIPAIQKTDYQRFLPRGFH